MSIRNLDLVRISRFLEYPVAVSHQVNHIFCSMMTTNCKSSLPARHQCFTLWPNCYKIYTYLKDIILVLERFKQLVIFISIFFSNLHYTRYRSFEVYWIIIKNNFFYGTFYLIIKNIVLIWFYFSEIL